MSSARERMRTNRVIIDLSILIPSNAVFVERKYRRELCIRFELLHEINCCKATASIGGFNKN